MSTPKTATLVTSKGDKFEAPLVCSFSHTIAGKTFLFVVTKDETAVPGTVFADPHRYIVSHAASGMKATTCTHSMREGILGAAQTAVDALVKRYGGNRVRLIMEAAQRLESASSN